MTIKQRMGKRMEEPYAQYKLRLSYCPDLELPWVILITTNDRKNLSGMAFEYKHEAEAYLDSYYFMLSTLSLDNTNGL